MHPAGWLAPHWGSEGPSALGGIDSLNYAYDAMNATDPQVQLKGMWDSLVWTMARTVLLGTGMFLFTREPSFTNLAKQAFGASLAIETFVFAWAKARGKEPLPSDSAAEDFLAGKEGSLLHMLGTLVARSAIAGLGVYLAGETRLPQVALKGFAAAASIEALILATTEPAKT